jgi:hypothetical protein
VPCSWPIINKYLQVNVSFLQTKGATPCSLKTPVRDMVHLQSLTLSGSCPATTTLSDCSSWLPTVIKVHSMY